MSPVFDRAGLQMLKQLNAPFNQERRAGITTGTQGP